MLSRPGKMLDATNQPNFNAPERAASLNRSAFAAIACLITLAANGPSASAQFVRTLEPVGIEQQYITNIRQVTSTEKGFFNAGESYFSPDGKMLIFQATPIGQKEYQIYTVDLTNGATKMVSTGKGACTCAFFRPDGKKILFASSHLDPNVDQPRPKKGEGYEWDFNEHMDIFEADPDGSNMKRLTDAPGYDAEGSYSPDGKSIVFTSQRDGDLELYVMNADGSGARRITSAKGYDGGPFFSPDGKRIIYRADHRNDGKMNLQLRVVNADGSDDKAITDNPIFNWCPFWHPSGSYVIFTQTDHEAYAKGGRPNYDLFATRVDGGKMVRITADEAFDGLPSFSPDGKKLTWTSKRGGLEEPQVYIANYKSPGGLE